MIFRLAVVASLPFPAQGFLPICLSLFPQAPLNGVPAEGFYWPIFLEGEEENPLGSMPIYGVAPDAVSIGPRATNLVETKDVSDKLDGCTIIQNVLSTEECENIIEITEKIGYSDFDAGKNTHGALTWVLDSEALLRPLFSRCKTSLPALIEGRQLAGLNQRCRFYRYDCNVHDTFRPHRDDSSPGSGFVDERGTHLCWDAHGDRASLLTFLLYLNDDFGGGETTFFPESSEEAVAVKPVQGSVIIFPQV
jgi:hypothetical protein